MTAVVESERTVLDEILDRYVGAAYGSCPSMRRTQVDALLGDDTRQRLAHTRLAATDWAAAETHGTVRITVERGVVTPRGLVYAAGMAAGPRRSLYYLATPDTLFDPVVGRATGTRLPRGSMSAVDGRLDDDLVFSWPLDVSLRHLLDGHELLRLP
ncbi:MAG TPA: hypothetical protein VGN37_03145 [Actinocatenispora sp.]